MLKDIWNLAGEAVGAILKGLGYAIEVIGEILGSIFGLAQEAVESILGAIGFALEEIGDFFEDVWCGIFGC